MLDLKQTIINALEDQKAQDIHTIDVKQLTDVTDYFIVCTGTSTRHVQGIANKLLMSMKETDIRAHTIEGLETGEWILIDFLDVVVHIMLPAIRELYDLEGLWAGTKELRGNED